MQPIKKVVREAQEIWDEGKEFVKDARKALKNRRKNYEEYMGDHLKK